MDISYINAGLVSISSKGEIGFLVALTPQQKTDVDQINVGEFEVVDAAARHVAVPGEFEFSGVEAVGLDVKPTRDGVANLFRLTIEGVSILVVTGSVDQLLKQDWEVIGDVDVLMASLAAEVKGLDTLVSKFEPGAVVIADGSKTDLEKQLGITVENTQKKISLKPSELSAEDSAAQYYLLG